MDELNKRQAPGTKIVYMTGEVKLKKSDLVAGKCMKEQCNEVASHRSNFIGREKLLCEEHAKVFIKKNGQMPSDLCYIERLPKK
jgi:hypothetical protein